MPANNAWIERQIKRRELQAAAVEIIETTERLIARRSGRTPWWDDSAWPYLQLDQKVISLGSAAMRIGGRGLELLERARQLADGPCQPWRRVRDRLRTTTRFRSALDAARSAVRCSELD